MDAMGKNERNVVSMTEATKYTGSNEERRLPSVRVQLTLRPEFAERIERLRKRSDKSYAEIVRDALKLFEQMENLAEDDGKFFIEKIRRYKDLRR
jgi:Ribbon-helix-helix protein, copG family.